MVVVSEPCQSVDKRRGRSIMTDASCNLRQRFFEKVDGGRWKVEG